MDHQEALRLFREHGALLNGHFELASGLHSDTYLQCALLLQRPAVAEKACDFLAAKWRTEKIDAVIGPATGGIIMAYELARQLGARALFAERVDGKMKLRRGFSVAPGENILVVEDVMTTGGSAAEVVDYLAEAGVETAGVACLVDRGGLGRFSEFPSACLLKVSPPTWKPKECPLCAEGRQVDKPGSKGTKSV